MKSTIGGYLSLVNSHSPKTNQSFSFSDNEYGASADNSDEDDNDNSAKRKSKKSFDLRDNLDLRDDLARNTRLSLVLSQNSIPFPRAKHLLNRV